MAGPNATFPLVLASSSARREKLLSDAGYDFEVIAPTIREPDEVLNKLTPSQQAEALGYFKARSVIEKVEDACVLGADTIVAVGERILGKPSDRCEGEQMLRMLSGTRQEVITGVALLRTDGRRLIASDTSYVTMRTITDAEIRDYLDSGEWEGKAGAYAIQETADRFVEHLEGSFTNVVGLPMELLERMMREIENAPVALLGV